MKLLRDMRENTKLLILLAIVEHPQWKLKALSAELAITVQGVSDYMKLMQRDGLVQNVDGAYRPTKEGVQFLHDRMRELKEFTDAAMARLTIIDTCVALAATPVSKGDTVSLSMQDGILTAAAGRSAPSTGIAATNAARGDAVTVTHLEGMLDLTFGTLVLVDIPPASRGPLRETTVKKASKIYKAAAPDKVAALDVPAMALLGKMAVAADFSLAPMHPILEAVQKGLTVLVFGTGESVGDLIAAVSEFNATMTEPITYRRTALIPTHKS